MQIDAHMFGEWAAHPGVSGDDNSLEYDWWVVTHVPNGMNCAKACGQLDEATAIRLARMLAERVPACFVPVFPPPYDGKPPENVRRLVRSVIFDTLGEIVKAPRVKRK